MTEPTPQPNLFPGLSGSVVLSDDKVRSFVSEGLLVVGGFDQRYLQSCSYDIRVGKRGILGGQGREVDLSDDLLELGPGAYAGLVSLEKLRLPLDVFARIGAKRSMSYEGIILLTGSLVDPGYEGHLLFGVYNASQNKVLIRVGMKICNIVFELLPSQVEHGVQPDPDLLHGRLPEQFLTKMANMEVLPWHQISERVRDIEKITSDIIDLKARYDDVLQPIKKLTESIDQVTADVSALTKETRRLTHDLDALRGITGENAKQISQITAGIGALSGELKDVAEQSRRTQDAAQVNEGALTALAGKFGKFTTVVYVFWGLLILALGAALPSLVQKLFGD